MRGRRKKAAVAAILVVTVVLSTGIVLFFNGHGPMARRDRRIVQTTAQEAEARINDALRTTMDGISPPVTYLGGDYTVMRDRAHWDGEPNLKSEVTGIVAVQTRISPAKLPALLDQITRAWEAWGCRTVERYESSKADPKLTSLSCHRSNEPYLSLSASAHTSYVSVSFSADLDFVRYRPSSEYGPVPPLVKRPKGGHGADLDDPYWSH